MWCCLRAAGAADFSSAWNLIRQGEKRKPLAEEGRGCEEEERELHVEEREERRDT